MTSVSFFKKLDSENRIEIVRIGDLLEVLRTLYRKSHMTPHEFVLVSSAGWIKSGPVYVGIVKADDVSVLFEEFGDALFFENIREFLGIDRSKKAKDREYVNVEIVATLEKDPARMLAKNNGLTVRAKEIDEIDSNSITVKSGAIVNGCQTANCIHLSKRNGSAEVLVKVVVSDDGWDVAQSANYQNPVRRIDLEIAKYVRPAQVQKFATSLGFFVDSESSDNVIAVVGAIYRHEINYDSIRTLFLGIFSRKPSNMFQNNYTEISTDVVQSVFEKMDIENDIFRVLFMAVTLGNEALAKCANLLNGNADIPLRVFDETKNPYRMLLLLLALAAASSGDFPLREDNSQSRADGIISFLADIKEILETKRNVFENYYKQAFVAISEPYIEHDDIEKAQKAFYSDVLRLDFSSTVKRMRLRVQLAS